MYLPTMLLVQGAGGSTFILKIKAFFVLAEVAVNVIGYVPGLAPAADVSKRVRLELKVGVPVVIQVVSIVMPVGKEDKDKVTGSCEESVY